MKVRIGLCVSMLLSQGVGWTAPKPHIVALGKWSTVKWLRGDDDNAKSEDLKVRPLTVDGKSKEWTIGIAHDVTERTFVVQRVYRLNDSLPEESGGTRWRWERGAWLMVDRITGKVQAINLVGFDSYASAVSWFRDYAAYCGTSDDGKKTFALVVQLGRRKPLLKKELAEISQSGEVCPTPAWARNPARVAFAPSGQAFTYTVASHAVDIVPASEQEDDP